MKRTSYTHHGLHVVHIKTDKFKTTDILVNFRNYLDEETATARALIPGILRSGSQQFPSKQAISRELERLYGASLGSGVLKQGRQQILSFRMSLVNDAYLKGEDHVLDDAFRLLADVLFQPLLEEGQFLDKIVKTEKRLLEDNFDALYDNKIRYAFDRLLQHMYAEETYRFRSIGKKEAINELSAKDLYEAYQDMLENDAVELFIIGDVDEERVKKIIEQYFDIRSTRQDFDVLDLEEKTINELNEVVEYQDIHQAKLNIGLRTYTRGLDADYPALLVMNGMLGGYAHSLLFKNVREKHSLCYYISSTIDRAKGAMFIYAGIAPNDYQKAVDLTFEQIETIKNGEFDEDLLVNTKNQLVNDLLKQNDNPSAIIATDFASLLYGEVYDVNKRIQEIQSVTKEEVIQVAQKLQADTVYCLTNKGVAGNE